MIGQNAQVYKQYFPIEEAFKRSVEQNVARDHRLGLIPAPTLFALSPAEQNMYLDYARHKLELDGENDIPESPDEQHICISLKYEGDVSKNSLETTIWKSLALVA